MKLKKLLGLGLCLASVGTLAACSGPTVANSDNLSILKQEHADYKESNEVLKLEVASLNTEVATMKSDLETYKASDSAKAEVIAEKEALLAEKESELANKTALLAEKEALIAELKNSINNNSQYVWTDNGLKDIYSYRLLHDIRSDIMLNGEVDRSGISIYVNYQQNGDKATAYMIPMEFISGNITIPTTATAYFKEYNLIDYTNGLTFTNAENDYVITRESFNINLSIKETDELLNSSINSLDVIENLETGEYIEIYHNLADDNTVNLNDYLETSGTYRLTLDVFLEIEIFDDLGNNYGSTGVSYKEFVDINFNVGE